jgi:outer membrane protein assembly factor BamB
MGAKKINKKNIAVLRYVLIATIVISSVLLAYQIINITGAFSAGNQEWENSVQINADNSTPEVRAHVIFGDNKPYVCKNGIYVENSGAVVQFKTENEMYDSNSQCTETDIVIVNSGTNVYDVYYGLSPSGNSEKLKTEAGGGPPCSWYCDSSSCGSEPSGECYWMPGLSQCVNIHYTQCIFITNPIDCAGPPPYFGEQLATEVLPQVWCGWNSTSCVSCSAYNGNQISCEATDGCMYLTGPGECTGDNFCAMGPPPANETVDLGDAPDSTNDFGVNMTAYSGVQANFPTVYVNGSPPYGPCHNNFYAQLGTEISLENESDTGPDQDVVNNIDPVVDTADNDSVAQPFGMDDGLKYAPIDLTTNNLTLNNCNTSSIPIELTLLGGAIMPWTAYVNIWIDYNRDGDWGMTGTSDVVACPNGTISEWVVQNYQIAVPPSGLGTINITVNFTGYVPSPSDAWLRVQLTDANVTYADGSGPLACYEDGETEDYYTNIIEEEAPSEICNNSIDDDSDGKIDCADNDCNLNPACAPLYSKFDGNTTDFANIPDLTDVSSCALEIAAYGKIVWDNYVNAAGADFDTNVNIGQGFVSVDPTGLNSSFNSSAHIWIYGVSCPVATIYYQDGHFSTASAILSGGSDCEFAGICTNKTCSSNTLEFDVSHFTGYAIGTNSTLTIFDETDPEGGSQTKYPGDQVIFFANYTNATGPIDGADCNVSFADSLDNPMNWNASSYLYEYNRSFISAGTFDWNVTCNKTGFDTLTTNDTVLITPTPGFGADLLPISIDTTPYGPEVEDGVTTSAVILNNGTSSSGEFNVTFFVENNVECVEQNLTLENNTNLTTSCDWQIGSGMQTVKVVVDLENNVNETDKTNNNLTDAVSSAWSGFQQGEQRRGVAHIGGPVDTASTLCSFTSPGVSIFKSAIFDGNQYYFVGYDSGMSSSALYAIDKNCTPIWNQPIGGSGLGGFGVESVPAIDAQGRVFIGSDNGILYGFDAATGTNLTGFPVALSPPPGNTETSPVVVDDVVYIAGVDSIGNGQVYFVNATNGGTFGPPPFGGEPIYSSIGYDDGFIYFGTDAGNVYKVNALTGGIDPNFPYSANSSVRSAIAIVGNNLYFQDNSTPVQVYAVNKNTRLDVWAPTSLTGCSGFADVPGVMQASLTVDGSRIYAQCNGALRLFMLDAATGNITQNTSSTGVLGKACSLATVNDMLYCQDTFATYGIHGDAITSIDWPDPSITGYSAPTPGSLGYGGISGPAGKVQILGTFDLKPIKSNYAPYGLLGGETVYINYTIQNQGSAALFADFNVSFYLDGVFQSKQLVTDTINSGYTVTLGFNATVNGDGPHDLKVVADSDNDIAESDETNNNLARTVDVDWSTFHQGNDRQGFSSVDTAPITNRTKWIFNTSGYIFSSPIIVDDVVYIGSNDKNIYAINLTSGSKIWNYTTSGWVMSTPAYYNGTIYVGSGQWPQGEKKIYAIYTNGSLRWSYTTGDNLGLSSPVISDGILYMGGHDGTLRALYASNGTQIWTYKNGCGGGNLYIENAASVIDNLIYASNNCNGLQIRNIKDGSFVANVKYGSGFSAAIDGDVIYSIDLDKVYASNRFNGTTIWNASMSAGSEEQQTGPAIAYGMVYAGDEFQSGVGTAKFYAFNKTDGSQIWNFTVTGYESVRSTPAVAAGIVYFKAEKITSNYTVTYASAIFALNATNGNLIWKYAGDGLAPSSPAITPGSSIMVVGFNNSILAFGTIDLVPLQLNVTPANLTVGQLATINVSVKNNGSLGSGFFNISLLVDNVEQSRQETELDFGMTQNYIFNWTAVFGLHNITIAVDPDNAENDETNENNNNITTTVNVTDAMPPSVTNVTPLADTNFTVNNPVNITANVTDDVAVDTVLANITLPNGASQILQMLNASSSTYNATFSNTSLAGRYNVTIIANDTSNNINNTETTYFNVVDVMPPSVTNITPLADTNFTANDFVNITANVTDNVAVDTVLANITLPDSTSQMLQMFNASGSIYNTTFSSTSLVGRYNVTIIANDTSNNINDTETTYFNVLPSMACNLSVLIDGVNTTSFTNAGEPYNVTVNVTDTGGSPLAATINAVECSGLNQFALIQAIDSMFSNCDDATIETGSDGIVSWTDVPTGGSDIAGTYNVTIRALSNGTVCDEKNFTVINRSPPEPAGPKSAIPNKANVEGINEQILVIFDRISRSRLSGAVAGETFDVTIYDNGTAVGMPATITSGRPTGLNITILNASDVGIANVTIKAIEKSGLNHWALIQITESNVSSEVTGTTKTNNNGNVRFTIVPTGGVISPTVDTAIGNYSVRLQVVLPNGTLIFNNTITVDRTLPEPSPTESVPSASNIEGFNEAILVLFDRVSRYLGG